MSNLGDGLRDVFMAGVGALAIGAEKSKELVDTLIEKGALTVDQGKEINSELKNKAHDTLSSVRDDVIQNQLDRMTKEERDAFAAKVAEMAAASNAKDAAKASEDAEVEVIEETTEDTGASA